MKVAKLLAFILMFSGVLAVPKLHAQHKGSNSESENHPSQKSSEEGFNAGEMIMSHLQDAHEIHLGGDVAIYLPVILVTDEGLDIFSSAHLYHHAKTLEVPKEKGETLVQEYHTYKNYVMYEESIYHTSKAGNSPIEFNELGEVANVKPLDISPTKSVVGFLLAGLLMIWLFGAAARRYKKHKNEAPKGIQSFLEPLIIFVRDEIAVPSIGSKAKAEPYLPFLLTIFFFIWIANMMGLLPFLGFNITGTIGVTLALAALVFVISVVSGNKHFWGHIFSPSGVPWPIKLILVPIEFAQVFIRPTVLMIRLTANMTAGHITILSFVALIFIFVGEFGKGVAAGAGIGSVLFMIFIFFIELLIAFLQAYVFALLSAIYFGESRQEPAH